MSCFGFITRICAREDVDTTVGARYHEEEAVVAGYQRCFVATLEDVHAEGAGASEAEQKRKELENYNVDEQLNFPERLGSERATFCSAREAAEEDDEYINRIDTQIVELAAQKPDLEARLERLNASKDTIDKDRDRHGASVHIVAQDTENVGAIFAVGEHVMYWSDTWMQWMHAVVQGIPDRSSTIDLDVKGGAQKRKVKKISGGNTKARQPALGLGREDTCGSPAVLPTPVLLSAVLAPATVDGDKIRDDAAEEELAGLGRLFLQFAFGSAEQTVSTGNALSILDWDDTLFPTFAYRKKYCSLQDLLLIDRAAEHLLMTLARYGDIKIITLASREWLEPKLAECFPRMQRAMQTTGTGVMYARDYHPKYMQEGYDNYENRVEAKAAAMTAALSSTAYSVVVGAGDQRHDAFAISQAAVRVEPRCAYSALMLRDRPSPAELREQLQELRTTIPRLISEPTNSIDYLICQCETPRRMAPGTTFEFTPPKLVRLPRPESPQW